MKLLGTALRVLVLAALLAGYAAALLWDGRAYRADWRRRGLREVACEGTRNAGLVPARELRAGGAS